MNEALTAIGERQPSKVGIEPARHVSLMENHDQAYYIWRDAGVKQRVLVLCPRSTTYRGAHRRDALRQTGRCAE